MSIYCYLACTRCKEKLFIKDADSDVHADGRVHGQFLEKHHLHPLVFCWEGNRVADAFPSDWPTFQEVAGQRWSHGNLYDD